MWPVKTTDIKSAFLQGKRLKRDVYLTPPKEADTPPGKIWKLNQCLYGLNDAARQFYESVVEVLNECGCRQSQSDPALFYLHLNGNLVGMIANHIDDFLHCGEPLFDQLVMNKVRKRFLAGKFRGMPFSLCGIQHQPG